MYDGVKSEVLSTMRLDEIKVEARFPLSEQGYTVGKLLDGTEFQIPLDMGTSRSFMSKSYYLKSLPEFASKAQRIQVGNGQCVSVLFIIPIVIDINGHSF